jgi:hypothetical protein
MPTYAIWQTVGFALNILAFIFIGLQIRPILERAWKQRTGAILWRRRCGPAGRYRRAPRLAHVLQFIPQLPSLGSKVSKQAIRRRVTNLCKSFRLKRAGSRVRTDDLLITNQLLYQLSYAGLC